MDIHTMMANAAADVRAMELRIVHLQDEVQRVNLDNERLRQENASITAARMHAEADLVHYQNVFVASVCVEAGSICREFFNLTQEKVRERAEGAIQKYVEERVNKEREDNFNSPNERELAESKVAVYSEEIGYKASHDRDDHEEFDKSIKESPAKPAEVQDTNTLTSSDDKTIQAPSGTSFKQVKEFYFKHLGYLPRDWRERPVVCKEVIPSFLTEPKKEEPPTTLRALIATVGF